MDPAVIDTLDLYTIVAFQVVPWVTCFTLGDGGIHFTIVHFNIPHCQALSTAQEIVCFTLNTIRGTLIVSEAVVHQFVSVYRNTNRRSLIQNFTFFAKEARGIRGIERGDFASIYLLHFTC
jgi:hypothetical protein